MNKIVPYSPPLLSRRSKSRDFILLLQLGTNDADILVAYLSTQ